MACLVRSSTTARRTPALAAANGVLLRRDPRDGRRELREQGEVSGDDGATGAIQVNVGKARVFLRNEKSK